MLACPVTTRLPHERCPNVATFLALVVTSRRTPGSVRQESSPHGLRDAFLDYYWHGEHRPCSTDPADPIQWHANTSACLPIAGRDDFESDTRLDSTPLRQEAAPTSPPDERKKYRAGCILCLTTPTTSARGMKAIPGGRTTLRVPPAPSPNRPAGPSGPESNPTTPQDS